MAVCYPTNQQDSVTEQPKPLQSKFPGAILSARAPIPDVAPHYLNAPLPALVHDGDGLRSARKRNNIARERKCVWPTPTYCKLLTRPKHGRISSRSPRADSTLSVLRLKSWEEIYSMAGLPSATTI